MNKVCKDCGNTKPIKDYYHHKGMKDGYLNKCKDCVKHRVHLHREENIESIREYDLERARRGRVKEIRQKFPSKYKARGSVASALACGKLIRPDTCGHCNKYCKPHAHHWSYKEEYWLDVIWLCLRCHSEEHIRLRESGADPDN
tara:strand:- start:2059 stop:2490 length:432 start_codon:yes stop_codon:yes gene_type:complete